MTSLSKVRLSSWVEILKTSSESDGAGARYEIDDNAPFGRLNGNIEFDLADTNDLSWNPKYTVVNTSPEVISTVGDGYDGLLIIPASGTVGGNFIIFVRILEALGSLTPNLVFNWLGEAENIKLSGVGDYLLLKTNNRSITSAGTKQLQFSTVATASACNVEFFIGRVPV